ncbi:uncharacterized protein LOC135700442 [Ochlerotatus camptorhynchus]|uniref:uncharacterized protein LOC135700442 n=1 Tax=Ochlerotatus camptorhynchus TaxID=644619 RepID=UPI0031E2EBA2
MDGEIMLTGDFNARHPMWDDGVKPCAKGTAMANELANSKLVMLNDGQSTTIPRINSSPTAIDLSFATSHLASLTNWNVLQEEFGSMHLCISMTIQSEAPISWGTRKKVNVQRAIEGLNSLRPQYLYSPEEMQQVFEEQIEAASYVVKNKKADFLKAWWNKDLQKAYNEKRKRLRNFNKEKSLNNQKEMQKARAVFKKLVRKEKRKYVHELQEKIEESTPPKQIWNIIRGLDTALTGSKKGADHSPSLNTAMEFMRRNYVKKTENLTWKHGIQQEKAYMGESLNFEEIFKRPK